MTARRPRCRTATCPSRAAQHCVRRHRKRCLSIRMRLASYLVRALAVLLIGLAAIAVPFVLIYLIGAISTGGREYVGEFMVLLGIAGFGALGGWGALRVANAMVRSSS